MRKHGNKKHRSQWIKDLGGGAVQARYGRTAALAHLPKDIQATSWIGSAPDADLKLQWAHGYNGSVVGSLHWTSDSEFAFPLSGLCVMESLGDDRRGEPTEQKFFLGHSEEVTCLAFNEATKLCASGQSDPTGEGRPFVCVWRLGESEEDCILLSTLVFHSVQVQAAGFNPDGKLLFTVGAEQASLLAAWTEFVPMEFFKPEFKPGFDNETKIEKLPLVFREPKATVSTGKVPAFTMAVYNQSSPDLDACFLTYDAGRGNAGMTLKYWTCTYQAKTKAIVLEASCAIFGQSPAPRRVLFCSWMSDRRSIVCGDIGLMYVFQGNAAILHYQVCSGPVGFGVEIPDHCFLFASRDATLYFGGLTLPTKSSNGRPKQEWLFPIRLCDIGGALVCSTAQMHFNTVAVRRRKDGGVHALMGTADHHLVLIDIQRRRLLRVLHVGHSGETWALSHHPGLEDGLRIFASGNSDGKLRFWDPDKRCPVVGRVLNFNAEGIWWPQGRVSTRNFSLDPRGIYALSFNETGDLLAIGHGEGTLRVLTFPELQPIFEQCISKARGRLKAVKFDPRGQFLAAASEDTCAYLFRIERKGGKLSMSLHHQLKGNTSSLLHVQFNAAGTYLITNSADAQVLCYSTETGKRLNMPHDEAWASPWTCKCGWPVIGMWSANRDMALNDINSCCSLELEGASGGLLASGGDDQKVKLYRFPAVAEEQQYREYTGHAAHVTAVRFSAGRHRPGHKQAPKPLLVSAGGRDHTLLQWEVHWLAGRAPASRRNQPWVDIHPWKLKSSDPDLPPERLRRMNPIIREREERRPAPYFTAPTSREPEVASDPVAASVDADAAATAASFPAWSPWSTQEQRGPEPPSPNPRGARRRAASTTGSPAGTRRPPFGTADDVHVTSPTRTAAPPPFGVDVDPHWRRNRGEWPRVTLDSQPSWISQDTVAGNPAQAARHISRGGRPASAGSTRRHSPI